MVEILWNSNAPHSPIQDHELVELRLVDFGKTGTHRFVVREIHASWSASAQQIQWKGYQDQTCGTQQEAQQRFRSLRKSIQDSGFPFATVLG